MKEKISPRHYAILDECYFKIWHEIFIGGIINNPHTVHDPSPEALDKMFNSIQQRYTVDYPRPTPDEVAAGIASAIVASHPNKFFKARRTIEKFQQLRAGIPENMEEVVILHYRESEKVRDLRRRLFSASKAAFLTDLARTHKKELTALGLSESEIETIEKTGKLPDDSTLTVEHIIDREHGGTNHAHNFILMSGTLNERKNSLKLAQTNFITSNEKGCWILSWVPKKNLDGTYPKILTIDSLKTAALKASATASEPLDIEP